MRKIWNAMSDVQRAAVIVAVLIAVYAFGGYVGYLDGLADAAHSCRETFGAK